MAEMILATGNKLMIAFFGMPRELAVNPQAEKRRPNGATVCFSAPKDYRQWEEMCADFTRHVIAKYGRDEVIKWTFRCWNEPNLPTFWHRADMNAYLKLYDHFAQGVKQVCPDIPIGGPALSSTSTFLDPKFFRMFLNHVTAGTNHATGGTGSPIDFISIHTYGGSSGASGPGREFPDVEYMLEQQNRYADIRDEFPALRNVPIHVEEWGETSGGTTGVSPQKPTADVRNSEYGAAFLTNRVAHHIQMRQENDRLIRNITFCASGYEAPRPRDFMGYRTLDTKNQFHKPILNAYKLLDRLSPDLVSCVVGPAGGPITAFATRNEKRISVLVTHYRHDRIHSEGEPAHVELKITPHWAPQTRASLTHWRIDRHHSNAYTAFRSIGSPENPTPGQIETVKNAMKLESLEKSRALDDGLPAIIHFEMPPNSVSLLEFTSH